MLSRSIFRSLPRTTSRIASYSTRTSTLRTITQPLFRQAVTQSRLPVLRAAFSTSTARRDDIGQELAVKLQSEISLERDNEDNQADSDSNVKQFLEQNDFWVLSESATNNEVLLTRTYDDETITVGFNVVDFNATGVMPGEEAEEDDAYMDEEDDVVETGQSGGANTKGAINQGRTSGGNIKVAPEDRVASSDMEDIRSDPEDDDYESQAGFPANVNVLIQRPDNKGALRINLITNDGRFTINGVAHLPEPLSASPAELLRQTSESLYTGPPFQQLDEEVQGLLEQYLDARGINTALALFIPDFIDVKEQREYLGWLERVKYFVE